MRIAEPLGRAGVGLVGVWWLFGVNPVWSRPPVR
jgi:hypothetical protein